MDFENTIQSNEYNVLGAKAYNRMGFGLLALTLGMMLSMGVASVLLTAFAPDLFANDWISMLITYLCMYLVGFPLYYLVMRGLPTQAPNQVQKKKISPKLFILLFTSCYFITTILNLFTVVLNNLIGTVVPGYNADTALDLSQHSQVILFICGVIIAPIMEEVMFRGLPLKKLGIYGAGIYSIYTGIAFGLFHFNLAQFFYAAVLGVIFAKIAYATGTIKYTIILHFLINLISGVGLGGIIVNSENEIALIIYSVLLYILIFAGLGSSIYLLIKRRDIFKSEPADMQMTKPGKAFLNPGSILNIVVSILMIILGIVSIALAASTEIL